MTRTSIIHTLAAVAEICDVSKRTTKHWADTGELRTINVSRSRSSQKPRLRVLDCDLQAFLAGRALGIGPQRWRRRAKRPPTKQYV